MDGVQYFYSVSIIYVDQRNSSAAILIEKPSDFLDFFDMKDEKDVENQSSNTSALLWKSITNVDSIPTIDVMEFKFRSESKSGFAKGSDRRYVEIRFIVDTGNFQILL